MYNLLQSLLTYTGIWCFLHFLAIPLLFEKAAHTDKNEFFLISVVFMGIVLLITTLIIPVFQGHHNYHFSFFETITLVFFLAYLCHKQLHPPFKDVYSFKYFFSNLVGFYLFVSFLFDIVFELWEKQILIFKKGLVLLSGLLLMAFSFFKDYPSILGNLQKGAKKYPKLSSIFDYFIKDSFLSSKRGFVVILLLGAFWKIFSFYKQE